MARKAARKAIRSGKPAVAEPPALKQKRKPLPFPFILEALAAVEPVVRPMFGGYSVYVGQRVVFMLRARENTPVDNGLWLVFADPADADAANPQALRHRFPSLRKIALLDGKIKHWLVIPAEADDFEATAMVACEMVLRRDGRLGRVPESRRGKA